jgi:hypothetical protein
MKKERPLVVITDTDEIVMDNEICAVAITTTYEDPPPDTHIELPWFRHRHSVTGLSRRSAAVCNWLVRVRPGDIVEIKGRVPSTILLDIINRVRELNE